MNKPLILAVEDDTAVRNLITTTLIRQEKLGHWEKKKARKCCSGQKRSISDLQKK